MTGMRWNVREDDYYGGDLYVEWDGEPEDAMIVSKSFGVVWETWGGYGRVALTLTREEARELLLALDAAICAQPIEVLS